MKAYPVWSSFWCSAETNKQIYQIKGVKRLPGSARETALPTIVWLCKSLAGEFEVEGSWTTLICPRRRSLAFFRKKIHWQCWFSRLTVSEMFLKLEWDFGMQNLRNAPFGSVLSANDFVIICSAIVVESACAVIAVQCLGVIILTIEVPLILTYNSSWVWLFCRHIKSKWFSAPISRQTSLPPTLRARGSEVALSAPACFCYVPEHAKPVSWWVLPYHMLMFY